MENFENLGDVPVIDRENSIIGIVSRIDLLSYLAANES